MQMSNKRKAQLMAGPYTRLLAEHEKAMAEFYDALAETHKGSREFWSKLADEEREHKRLIMGIEEKLVSGEWSFARPKYLTSTIMQSIELIAGKKAHAEARGITMREALKLSADLENDMIESGFFQVLDGDSPEMMSVMESMETYSKAHRARVESESKRLKWRIVGTRSRKLATAHKGPQTSEKLKDTVKSTQSNMLGLLISLEEAASNLYNAYSERLKDSREFWALLAAEEMQHAAMLRGLYKLLEKGHIFTNIEGFTKEVLEENVKRVLNDEYDARHGRLSLNDAINTALKIERTMIETRFYGSAQCGAPEFQIIANRLVELTKVHIKKLDNEAGNVIVLGAAAAEDVPIPGQKSSKD